MDRRRYSAADEIEGVNWGDRSRMVEERVRVLLGLCGDLDLTDWGEENEGKGREIIVRRVIDMEGKYK